MAYEMGGATGQPYDKSEDLMYSPGAAFRTTYGYEHRETLGCAQTSWATTYVTSRRPDVRSGEPSLYGVDSWQSGASDRCN